MPDITVSSCTGWNVEIGRDLFTQWVQDSGTGPVSIWDVNKGNLSARNVVDGRAVGMISEVFEEIKVHTALLLRSSMAGTRVGVQQWLRGYTAVSVDTEGATACQTDATVYPKMQEVLTLHSDEEVNASMVSVSGILQQYLPGLR